MFNLNFSGSIDNYNSVDRSSKDGVLFSVKAIGPAVEGLEKIRIRWMLI